MRTLSLLTLATLAMMATVASAQSTCYVDAFGRRICPSSRVVYATPSSLAPQVIRLDSGTPVYQPVMVRPVEVQPQAQPVQAESSGFLNWLNSTRAQYGLAPVAYDPGLAADASVNSQRQASYGLGHWHLGSARRQNSGMGPYSAMPGMWLASPAHRAALLDPSVRFAGLAGAAGFWTLSLK